MKVLDALDSKNRGHIGYNRWTLCIGAGCSTGIVPSWPEFTRRVINSVFTESYSPDAFASLVSNRGWGLDSWIQSAANFYYANGRSREEFEYLLQNTLYSDLLVAAKADNLDTKLISAVGWPRQLKKKEVHRLCKFFEDRYSKSSLMTVVRWLISLMNAKKLPYAIITFNAEPLLHTLFELFQRRQHYSEPPPHNHPAYVLTRVVRPQMVSANVDKDEERKTCIYHCHGALIPQTPSVSVTAKKYSSLIFLEEDYLNVTTRAGSWPETLFLFHANLCRMVFVGLSMSDPNIRRWLGLSALGGSASPISGGLSGPPHIWIEREPADATAKSITNHSLLHLGVRPAWIPDWPYLEQGLRNLSAV